MIVKVLRYIDYIWFIGESFHRQEKSPGDGTALVMWGWYLDVVIILLTLFYKMELGWVFYMIIPALLSVPFLFCHFRYTVKRQDEILARFPSKKIGRKLLVVWAMIICIFCLEVFLMILLVLWTWIPSLNSPKLLITLSLIN